MKYIYIKIILILITLISVIWIIQTTNAATTTITYVGTVNSLWWGDVSWNNTNNIIWNNSSTFTEADIPWRSNADAISLTNFDLNTAWLPIWATINGIQVDIETNASWNWIRPEQVQLTKNGLNGIWTDLSVDSNIPTSQSTTTYWSSSELWWTTWSYSELLSTNFWVIVQYRNNNRNLRNANIYKIWITIDYTPNSAPTDITLSNQDIPSGIPVWSLVWTLTSTDADTWDTHTYSLSCSTPWVDDSSFAISGSNLNSNEVFDDSVKNSYNICIRTNDWRGWTFDKNFTITIDPPAPNNLPTDITLSNQNINEFLLAWSLVWNISTTDLDSFDSHVYSFWCSIPWIDDSSFSISWSDLDSNEIFDESIKNSYNICIRTDDSRGWVFDKNFTISIIANPNIGYAWTVTDLWGGTFPWINPNNAIWDTTSTSTTLTISTRNNYSNFLSLTNFTLLGTWLPTNAIINGIQVDVELMASGNGMKDETLQLTKDWINPVWNNYWNYVNRSQTKSITTYGWPADLWWTTWTATELLSSDFWVYLQYRNTNSNSRDLDIYRVNVIVTYNLPPTDIILSSNNIDENLSIWSNVGSLSTTDLDIWDTHSYSLACDTPWIDDASFAIAGSNLNSNTIFDYDTKSSYNICIRTDDWNFWTYDKNFIININNINQAPTDITLSNDSIFEWFPIGTNIWTLSTTDPDSWDTSSYGLSCSTPWIDDSSFTISGSNLNSNEVFNFTTKSTYNICIRTTDSWLLTYDRNFIINVNEATPSPWWANANLQIWLKADVWTSTTTSWNALNTWNDQSWNWYNATAWVAPTYLNSTTNHLNFNPIVDFDGTQYLQNLNNWAYTHSYFAVVVPDNTVDGTITGQVPFGFDCNSAVLNTWTCWLTFAWLTLWAFTAAINDEVITHAIWSSTGRRSAQIWTASYEWWKPMLINMNENASADWTEISEKWELLNNYNANTYQTLSTADYRLWMSTDWANPFIYDWKIAEIIDYSSRISPAEKQKIESYLSLKYGMTLDSGTKNYIASDWSSIMWSSSSAWAYTNDIFGIGRDNLSELWQIKSKSVNNNSVITIEAVSEWTNISPSFVDINNYEFLTIANNNLWNTWTATDSPIWYFNLTRKWRVQETWEVWTVNLDFDVWNSSYDIPDLSIGTSYYFTYDSDNDNSLADETPQIMTNTSWNIWQIAWINLNNLREFTISTQSSTNNIPTDISVSNNSVNENVSAWTTIWNLSTTDADSWDSHTYSLVNWIWDSDNSNFSIITNILYIDVVPDYELKKQYTIRIETGDWNWGTYQKAFIVNINNVWEIINTIIDFENISDEAKYSVTSWTWTRTTTNPYEWTYSLESGNTWLPNTQSCFEITSEFIWVWTLNFYYNVSSQAWGDYLRFYVDNNEQQNWSWNVAWTLYSDNTITAWTHSYKWCYIKDWNTDTWTDNSYIDYITFNDSAVDTTSPTISSINFASWKLLPWWNQNIIINYIDTESGIDTNSDAISLYKWNWSSWWPDIWASWLNLWTKIISAISATYSTNNLTYWKYRYNFSISDSVPNASSTGAVFYIDEPEVIISTWSLDIWNIKPWETKFSENEFTVTVKTVWAWFYLILNKQSPLLNWTIEITDWNTVEWFWYESSPYTSTINIINVNKVIATQVWSLNTDWEKNIYVYSLKLWALVWEQQAAWNYNWTIKFWVNFDY